MNFKPEVLLTLVLDAVVAKSKWLPLINSTASITQSGSLGDGYKVTLSPLATLAVDRYVDSAPGTPRPKFNRQRLVANSTVVQLNELLYAQIGINGIDVINFQLNDGAAYDSYVNQIAEQIAYEIDTAAAGAFTARTGTAVTVEAGTRDEVALSVLDAINAEVDDLADSGITTGITIVAHPGLVRRVQPLIENAAFTGDAANVALRDNFVGRLYGAPVVKDSRIGVNTFVVLHPDAFVLANRPSGKSAYAASSTTQMDSTGKVAFTVTAAFDPDTQEDVLTVSTFANIGPLQMDTHSRKAVVTFEAA